MDALDQLTLLGQAFVLQFKTDLKMCEFRLTGTVLRLATEYAASPIMRLNRERHGGTAESFLERWPLDCIFGAIRTAFVHAEPKMLTFAWPRRIPFEQFTYDTPQMLCEENGDEIVRAVEEEFRLFKSVKDAIRRQEERDAATAHADIPDMVVGALADAIEIDGETLAVYVEQVGLPKTKQGQKNRRFTGNEIRRIADAIIATSSNAVQREAARKLIAKYEINAGENPQTRK